MGKRAFMRSSILRRWNLFPFESGQTGAHKKASEYIPETSRIYHVISDVSGAFEKGAELEKVMDYLETEYGDVDCSISFYNIGVIALALLYGNGEFEKRLHWRLTVVMIRIVRLPRWALFWELCMEKRFSGKNGWVTAERK